MAEVKPEDSPPESLRDVIRDFIVQRQLDKVDSEIKKLAEGDLDGRAELEKEKADILSGNKITEWIEDAARRASWLKLVSHAVKFGNPEASGTQVLFVVSTAEPETYAGTHSLGPNREDDVVGNAAALDVYKFLKLSFAEKSVLQHVREESAEMLKAIGGEEDDARRWVRDLASVLKDDQAFSSHPLSKQVYFPVSGDEAYHLLAPLFPTSLVHAVWNYMRKDSFGDDVKEAREARRKGTFCEHGYVDYPDIATQTFGGSKPQNISQLNSERRGEAWLLPSSPPMWRRQGLRPPLHVDSVFGKALQGTSRVDELISNLVNFLVKIIDYNNVSIRAKRGEMVNRVIDEVLAFGWERHQVLKPGWSADPDCRLVECERLWLDPGRATSDPGFAATLEAGDWQNELARRFAGWFNTQIRYHSKKKKELTVGADEQAEWTHLMQEALKMEGWGVNHD